MASNGDGKNRTTAGRRPGAQGPSARPPQGPGSKRPTSQAVYRRRRLVVGVLALVVLALILAGGVNLAKHLRHGAAPAASSTSSTGTTAVAAPACAPGDIRVTAKVNKDSFAADEDPLLTLTVDNAGTTDCQINVGTSQMDYVVTSGTETVFNSKDCQASSTKLIKTLSPGNSETANLTWQRNSTLPGCAKDTAKAAAGGAYYTFTASLGGVTSPKVTFQLQ